MTYTLHRSNRAHMPRVIEHDAERASAVACSAINARLRNRRAFAHAECFTDEFHVFVHYPNPSRHRSYLVAVYHFT